MVRTLCASAILPPSPFRAFIAPIRRAPSMAQRFAGRKAIVTGGVSGIGAGIARHLAAEGARLSLWDMDEAGLGRSGAAHTVVLDVTDSEAVHHAAEATAAALGKIDILV